MSTRALRAAPVAPLVQVLLFAEERNLREYGRAVWAAFEEVAGFFRMAVPDLRHHRFVYDSGGTGGEALRAEWSDGPGIAPGLRSSLWQSLRSRSPGFFEQPEMAATVRGALGEEWSEARLLVCTDQPIRPPEDLRYVLWDYVAGDVVVSTATMDPAYWGIRTADRVATVKHRMRTASLSGTAWQLDLKPCSSSICFLYRNVTSVECLDTMLLLGPEHGIPRLDGLGFDPGPENPDEAQKPRSMRSFGGTESA